MARRAAAAEPAAEPPVDEKKAPARRAAPGPAPRGAQDLDRLIHERVRLAIVSALAATESMTFNELKKLVSATDGNLSTHARRLEDAGYIAWGENTVAPWAPFYAVYAALAVWVPLRAGAARFSPLRSISAKGWAFAVAAAVLLQVAGGALLQVIGHSNSLAGALEAMFAAAAVRFHADPGALGKLYLTFVLLWAGAGEEILYRGYVHGALRGAALGRGGLGGRSGFALAAGVSALLFAVRHGAQLALVSPYPWPAAAAWSAVAFLVGIALSAVYERTGSLTVPVIIHYVFNLIPTIPALLG